MSEKKRTAKILALIMSLILMLAGCGAGSGAADESDLMNAIKYDVAIPGNHEFDYSMENFKDENGKAIDPEATYTVAGQDYLLVDNGDGFTMFGGEKNVISTGKLDSEVLIGYIKDTLGGKVGADYADPYGQGRIKIVQ